MSIERSLIEHCSPTLASLKVGSLFSFLAPANADLHEQVRLTNAMLESKGLTLLVMKSMGDRALCYLYRASQLRAVLANEDNAAFLRENGYDDLSVDGALNTLHEHLKICPCFPHEIGLFLGYPLGDVIGFIRNKGKNCLICGMWKSYTDKVEAQKLFDKFGKCTEVYKRMHALGRSLTQLTVAA
ncbi:MAG: DUF3793 family protein [Clostridia bacterium]|nr:DUF3793 family protein [Clostridia bacterium]